MRIRIGLYAALNLLAWSLGPAHAGLVNPGFETGDLTGWTTSLSGGTATVINDHVGDLGLVCHPPQGNYQLKILGGSANVWQTVSQEVSLTAGEKLCGYVGFDWRDYAPFYDEARVRILDDQLTVLATPWEHDGTTLPDYGDENYEPWSWTAPTTGIFLLEYSARNTVDGILESVAVFDTCPEPATLALCLLGALGLIPSLRKRRTDRLA
jgi:hypothetical protein